MPSAKVRSTYESEHSKDQLTARADRASGLGLRPVLVQLGLGGLVCHCITWLIWLILLNFAPNDVVNNLMHTDEFDDGTFWLQVQAPPTLVILATTGRSIFVVLYLLILVQLLRMNPSSKRVVQIQQAVSRIESAITGKLDHAAEIRRGSQVVTSTVRLAASMAHSDSRARQIFRLWMKVGDLAIESVILYGLLESGSPEIFIIVFAVIMTSNALSCVVTMFLPQKHTIVLETMVDIMFDLIVATEFPTFVLLYCFSTFELNRAQLAIDMEVFPPGWFERSARVVADPVQTAIVDQRLRALRIVSTVDLFTRMFVNSTLCYRIHDAVKLIQNPCKQRGNVYPKRHYPAAAFFILFTVGLVVFVTESLRTSTLACNPHPECAMYARRWTILQEDFTEQCPCLILIDRDVAPKSYAEWLQPRDVTKKVAQLAVNGELQGLLLTNRYLPVLPEELRRCTSMKHLSLEYTHTQTLPGWIKEFKMLEFIHVESKPTSPLLSLPEGVFDAMSSLTFIHLSFMPVTQLPSFDGLSNLRSATFAVFLALEELPSFDHLHHIERLVISGLPMLRSLPDLTNVKNLKSLVVLDRGEWCCNGFLGDCDLQNPLCQPHPVWGSPAATCLPIDRPTAIASPATLAAVDKFRSTVCGPVLRPEGLDGPPTDARVDVCNGTLWKQCNAPGSPEAMCYNERLMVIACTRNPLPIKMRRMQIQRGVGPPCSPAIESWLGC